MTVKELIDLLRTQDPNMLMFGGLTCEQVIDMLCSRDPDDEVRVTINDITYTLEKGTLQ